MEILELVNSYIKYAYIFLIVIICVLLIRLLVILARIGKNEAIIKQDTEYIKMYGEQLKEKSEIIDHTMKTSVPFFVAIFAGISLTTDIIKDYFDTRAEKRSIRKSVDKVYRYHHANDTAFKAATRKISKLAKH